MSSVYTDEQLMGALTRGETWALTAIYDRYARPIASENEDALIAVAMTTPTPEDAA